ncbi:uncharacterized oxidoreductase MexAM1_META1p0182 [Aplysia californica]|uniref:Uncharacterized oxidoreductase MexAM1_META1p0182 n=1 Tax=Aplysia californica TaxID=6500 RepID=A0ABM1ACS0_APLCA|nr:uncharacterized oxidoreductase MexAM1_META1p0182 [Aplysia californica]
MAYDLSGKVAIVTGSSSGMGQSIAVHLARQGAKVTLCGRDSGRLAAVKEECVTCSKGGPESFLTVQGDVTQAEVRQAIVLQTLTTFGQLDILVNNAGTFDPRAGTLTATPEIYDRMMDTNVKAVFFLIQNAVPYLEQSKGCIVNISSVMSEMAAAPSVLYPVSKAAIDHLTRCLALDLGAKGIRVNAVNPSFAPTRIWRDFGDKAQEMMKKFAEKDGPDHPLHGRCISPHNVAELVAFLASPSAALLTGQCIHLDAGRRFMGTYQVRQN